MKTLSGRDVSAFSFGTMQFGGTADEAASAALYAACRKAGINFFDTAHLYTGGASETILGDLIKTERDDIFVATKIGYDHPATVSNIKGYADKSRTRLGIDVIDLLYLHRLDPETPMEVQAEGLAKLVDAGVVRHLGLSNFAAWEVMKFREAARAFGIAPQVLQPMYNLVKRQVEVEILPMAASEGLHVCPYSPLGGGLLTGKYAAGDGGRLTDDHRYKARYGPDWMHETAAGLSALAAELDTHPATLAVAWVAKNPAVFGPIISGRSVEQLQPSLEAIGFDMDDALYDRITALSRPPAPATDRLEEA
ncbi:MAG: aldo/keto reductase [Silicimonas sp.]|nr:aldo/keto reductase [Silicimonas sp.]